MTDRLTGYQDDIEAIDRFITSFSLTSTPKITPQANELQVDWARWYGGLSWASKNFSKENWLLAQKKRDAFRIAMGLIVDENALTSEQVMPQGPPGAGAIEAVKVGIGTLGAVLAIGGTAFLLLYVQPMLRTR